MVSTFHNQKPRRFSIDAEDVFLRCVTSTFLGQTQTEASEFLCIVTDECLTWRPAVTDIVTSGRRVPSIFSILNCRFSGGAQGPNLLYRGLTIFNFFVPCLYQRFLLHNEDSELCLPSSASWSSDAYGQLATLVGAVNSPLMLQAVARTLRLIERLHSSPSCKQVQSPLNNLPRAYTGCLVTKLSDLIGSPSSDPPTFPPQGFCSLALIDPEFPARGKDLTFPTPSCVP